MSEGHVTPYARIVAWNLLHGGGPKRAPEAALALAALRPDICLLSEFRVARGSMLRSALCDTGLAHAIVAPHARGRNCVAVVSRWRLEEEWCGLDPGTAGLHSGRLVAASVPDLGLHLLGVHVPDESDPTGRAVCWRAIVEWAKKHSDKPALIGGDFNTSRRGIDPPRPGQTCEQMLGAMATCGFVDAWRLDRAGAQEAISWFGPRGERQRLDAIHVSMGLVKCVQSAFYDTTCALAGVSDHALLVVDVRLARLGVSTPAANAPGLFPIDNTQRD